LNTKIWESVKISVFEDLGEKGGKKDKKRAGYLDQENQQKRTCLKEKMITRWFASKERRGKGHQRKNSATRLTER